MSNRAKELADRINAANEEAAKRLIERQNADANRDLEESTRRHRLNETFRTMLNPDAEGDAE